MQNDDDTRVLVRLTALKAMTVKELKSEWKKLFERPAPNNSHAYPDRESAIAPYDSRHSRQHEKFCSLNPSTFPGSAQRFAGAWKLPVDYVDNAWLLVPVSPDLTRKFLSIGTRLGTPHIDPDIQGMIERVRDDRWYVINEEEY